MRTSSTRHRGRRATVTAILGLLLVGTAGTPANAKSTREKQWFLDAMKAEQMWQTSTGKGITVAVIDTGVDPSNPDLKGRVLRGKDFAQEQPGDERTDYDDHGTGMAGLIAGTGAYGGGKGAFGLAPGADILPVRMPDGGDVNPFAVPTYFSKGIRYAADSGAQIINISMGGGMSTPELTEAVRYALDKGSLVFAAMGNEADKQHQVEYPAATPGVVGVAAVGKNLQRTSWSQYGPQVDISAPGQDMVHACAGKTGLCETSGTSDATALASASAALIWSKHPTWTNNQILRVMLNTIGAPSDGKKRNDAIGYGIVRPRIALQNPGDPGPADKYPLPDLAAAESKSPSPEASQTADADSPAGDSDSTATEPPAKDNDTSWTTLGIGAAVLLGVAVALTVLIRRRRVATATSPTHVPAPGHFPHSSGAYTPPPQNPSSSVPPQDRQPDSR